MVDLSCNIDVMGDAGAGGDPRFHCGEISFGGMRDKFDREPEIADNVDCR